MLEISTAREDIAQSKDLLTALKEASSAADILACVKKCPESILRTISLSVENSIASVREQLLPHFQQSYVETARVMRQDALAECQDYMKHIQAVQEYIPHANGEEQIEDMLFLNTSIPDDPKLFEILVAALDHPEWRTETQKACKMCLKILQAEMESYGFASAT